MNVSVNGSQHNFDGSVSYEEICEIVGLEIGARVMWRSGAWHEKSTGILRPGERLELAGETRFDCVGERVVTDASPS